VVDRTERRCERPKFGRVTGDSNGGQHQACGDFFATWAGQVYKGMFPLLGDPEALYSPELKRSALLSHRTSEPVVPKESRRSSQPRAAA